MSDACLILFAKTPLAGRVKTRLCPPLTHHQAALLYRAFLQDIAESCGQLRNVDLALAYSGEPAPLRELVGLDWRFVEQVGFDLGERMSRATIWAVSQGYRRVVLIGSDSPGMPLSHLQQAFEGLWSNEVVIGPSMDGGYYLIGFGQATDGRHRWVPTIFEEITWSTQHVFRQTLGRLDESVRLVLLSPWYDVDTRDELQFLQTHLDAMVLADHHLLPVRTMRVLSEHGEIQGRQS